MRERIKSRAGLADFLQSRRARLHPEQFALPTFQRRRARGLRREELAQLVGVGVYTPLPQEDTAAKLRALTAGEHQLDKMLP